MEPQELLITLTDKDTSAAFAALKELEKISESSDIIYHHIASFAAMIKNDKYVLRVRGFRLLCKQARWDKESFIDRNFDEALTILSDAKPTAVRQALAALKEIVIYKPELHDKFRSALLNMNYSKYNESMYSLIEKDIKVLLDMMDKK